MSRRERQIMDVVYRLERATAADVHGAMPDAPTYTTVRGLLRILVAKGHLVQEREGKRYVYLPTTPRRAAGASHLKHVVSTFFGGSPAAAMAALLGTDRGQLSEAELARLQELIAEARRVRKGRRS